MDIRPSRIGLIVAVIVYCAWQLPAQDAPEETAIVTKHSIEINGQTISYSATAGTILLCEDGGKPLAEMFYVAYVKDDVGELRNRPLLFSFNGGPGASSAWMHLGFLGPKRVLFDDEGFALQPPYRLINNPYSILDVADVVFIDPVSTGYSRALPEVDLKRFHGIMEDIESVAEFIRIYVTRNGRWDSPKFIIGESYGTTRAAGLAGYLQSQNNHYMYLNGVILVSGRSITDIPRDGVLASSLKIGDYAATAWFHQQLSQPLQSKTLPELLDEVESFALEDYLPALIKGNTLPENSKRQAAQELSRYTGMSVDYLLASNLRILSSDFNKELLREKNLAVAGYDSRYTGIDAEFGASSWKYGAAMSDWLGPFTALINDYLRTELRYVTDRKYLVLEAIPDWKRDPSVDVGEMLRGAMIQNKYLRVFVAKGYYDSGILSARYCNNQLYPAQLKDRVKLEFYESGHMMYVRKRSLAKIKTDLADFIQAAMPK